MKLFKNLLIFASGAAIGSAVTWKLVKTKYELLAQEEINSMKEVYSTKSEGQGEDISEKDEEDPELRAKAEEAKEKPSVSEYAARLQKHGYVNYSDPASIDNDVEEEESEQEEEDMVDVDKPYVIAPEESGNGYNIVSLTYYADKVLADENDELIEDVEELVGFESLTHFGEYEDDSVYVRNDRLGIDYEILLDQRTYAEARKGRPSSY